MVKHLFTFIAFAMFTIPLFADTADPESVTLCSGEKMTWEMYLLNKKLLSYKYDMEIESVEFVSYAPSMMNNQTGSWSSVIDMPLVAVAAAHLPDGRIMTWSARDKFAFGGDQGRTWTCIFDPATNSSTEALIENTGHDMFCPSTNLLPDGRIMVNGGSSSAKASVYDPMTNGWSSIDELNIARGYHAGLTHASGATFVIGGSWSGGIGGKHSEVWTEKTGWYELPGVLTNVITDGIVSNQPERKDDYFPWLWNAPNGKIFHAGPSSTMHWIDPTGVGSWTTAGQRSNSPYATVGMSVMYDEGKILTLSGAEDFEAGTAASDKCYTIDINTDNAVAAQTDNLTYSRAYGNAVVLPDGQVMAIGGQGNTAIFTDQLSRLTPELWNPSTGLWTNMADMTVPRNYHSIAVLLLDGRVLVAGGGLCNSCSTNHADAQIFSPPYLFNNNGGLRVRPIITSAPTETDWNTNVVVNSNMAITEFVLVRQTSVTHSTSNGQRRIPVTSSSIGTNQYSIAIPDRNILPPGNYMLFAFRSNGTPSVAKVINIGDDINDCTPQGHANLGGTGLQGTYYNNIDFTNQVLQRNDATINFTWGTGAPAAGIDAETFSANWQGRIRVPRDGYYTFYTNSDDGVRLRVNGRLMVDNWTDHGNTEDRGFVELKAGQDYDIILDYYENGGGATIQLSWSGPGINKAIIAQQYLFPPDPCVDNDYTIVCEQNTNDAGYVIDGNCYIPVCPGDKLILSVNPNGYPTSWTGPNGYTNDGNNALIANSINNTHFGDYIATIDVNGCIKSETIRVAAGAGCDPCFGNGGDNDGDGVCGNDDCDDNNANLPATVGSSCNDGNSNTTNDVIQSDGCTCAGTPVGNNTCNADYSVSGNSVTFTGLTNPINAAKIIDLGYTTYWECNTWADPCGSSETINNIPNGQYYISLNTYDAGWGTICNVFEAITIGGGGCTDNDNDGVCAADDCDDNNANVPAPVGSSCNDGNANTSNDVIQSDGCTCAGTPVGNNTCDAEYSVSGSSVTITGLTNPVNAVKIIDINYATYWECNTWADPCSASETINNIPNGQYYISLNTYDAGWNSICNIFEAITIGGGGCVDNDNDGVCAADDCDDNNANVPAPVGSNCNDGNSNTTNDVIQSDGCTCAGTPTDGGCPVEVTSSNGQITITGLTGTNAKIFNSSWQEQWGCNPWTGNPCSNSETYNSGPGTFYVSVSSAACNFFEIIEVGGAGCDDSDNDGTCDAQDCAPNNPALPAPIGSPCNDFDSNTSNDIIQSDGCTCQGSPIGGGDCNIAYTVGTNSVTFTGLTDPIVSARIVDDYFNPIWTCNTFGTPCNTTETISNLSPGSYKVVYESFDSGWNLLCDVEDNITIGNAGLVENETAEIASTKTTIAKSETLRSEKLGSISMYPNPATDRLNINLKEVQGAAVTIEIYNTFGQLIYTNLVDMENNMTHEIDLFDFKNGIYNVSVVVDDERLESSMFVVTK